MIFSKVFATTFGDRSGKHTVNLKKEKNIKILSRARSKKIEARLPVK